MTPKAATAFAAYVALGPSRSIRALGAQLVRQNLYKNSWSAERTIAEWSSKYRWQDRLAAAVTALTEQRLEVAAEIDAGSFLRTSELLAERLGWTTPHHLDSVLDIRAAVRKPGAKGTTVNVNLILADLIEKHGLTPEEAAALESDIRGHLATQKATV